LSEEICNIPLPRTRFF